MSLFKDKLADLEAKHERQMAGLMAAHGLIEEAEALCAVIAVGMSPLIAPQPLVTVHDDGSVAVQIYVWAHHPDFRRACVEAGLEIAEELTLEPNQFRPNKSRSRAVFAGFSVPVEIEGELQWNSFLKEVA